MKLIAEYQENDIQCIVEKKRKTAIRTSSLKVSLPKQNKRIVMVVFILSKLWRTRSTNTSRIR